MNSRTRLILKRVATITADVLMINGSFYVALMLHFLWLVRSGTAAASMRSVFTSYEQAYWQGAWLLTLISLTVYFASGFYTRGRFYWGRYRALVIAQAVSFSYVVFGFLLAFIFGNNIQVPRPVLIMSWVINLVLVLGSRLWSLLWAAFVRSESRRLEPPRPEEVRSVLVIGGAGYIGSAVLAKLLASGYHVRLLDLLVFGKEPIMHLINHPNLEIIKADFLQVTKVVEAMKGVDAVMHLGAIVGDPACALDEELTIGVNVTATRMIAEVAKGNRVKRFIFASTCSVYGASDETLDERSTLNPVSLYARSKIASERVLMKMADDNFAPILLRFGTIYGLSGRTRFDLVVNLLAAKAVVDSQITVFGGDQWRPFVHVDDAALAVFKALEAPLELVRGEVFNVGSNEQNYTIQQVGEIIHRLVPTAQLLNMGNDSDRRNYRVDFTKIRKTFNFTPQWTVEQGAQQVIDAIKTGKVQDYRSAKYSNVKYLNLYRTVSGAFSHASPSLDFLGEEDTSRIIQRANTEQLSPVYDTTVEGWAKAMEQRSKEASGRTLRLTEMTVRLARAIGMSEAELSLVRRGVLLHDFGTMAIPESILQKPGPLEATEWDTMRKHVTYAHEMLSPIASLRPALDIPYCHHEKWDGTGYPRGLKGDEIPLAARIFAVVDVCDALRSDRPYRPAWSEEKVREYIRDNSGLHFDPRVVEVFLKQLEADGVESPPAAKPAEAVAVLANGNGPRPATLPVKG